MLQTRWTSIADRIEAARVRGLWQGVFLGLAGGICVAVSLPWILEDLGWKERAAVAATFRAAPIGENRIGAFMDGLAAGRKECGLEAMPARRGPDDPAPRCCNSWGHCAPCQKPGRAV